MLIWSSLILKLLVAVNEGIIYAMVALGLYIAFRQVRFPDLTCDGSFTTGAVVSGLFISWGANPWLSILAGMLGSGLAGAITGIQNKFFRVPNILAGVFSLMGLYSINLILLGRSNISLSGISIFSSNGGIDLYSKLLFQSMILFGVSISIILFLIFILSTSIGLAVRAAGSNPIFAEMCEINTSLTTIFGLFLANAIIGLGGALAANSGGYVDVRMGTGAVITGLAAVVIGEYLSQGKSYWLDICFVTVGSIIYRIVMMIALDLGMPTACLNLITVIILVFFIFISGKIVVSTNYQSMDVRL